MTASFGFDDRWRFPVSRHELWRTLRDTERYQQWWGWLREFDAPALEAGSCAHAVIGPPLPYSLSVQITITDVVPAESISTRVSGDLAGSAALYLADGSGSTPGTWCEARLVWDLDLHHRVVGPAARLLRPLLEWGHRWVVHTGIEQFRHHALPAPTSPFDRD